MISNRVTLLLAGLFFSATLDAQILPPLPVGRQGAESFPQSNTGSTAAHLFVRAFQFEGNRAFSDADLNRVTGSLHKSILASRNWNLLTARSLFYVNHASSTPGQ